MTFAQKLILTFIILALLMRVPIFLVRYFDPDEFEHLHAARNIYHGMVPYRDYFEHHTPFLHFLLAPLYFIWGDSIPLIFVARGIMLIFTCGILYLTYRLTKMLYGCDAALFATLFLSCTLIFLEKTIEVRPDLPEVIFWLLTIIFLIRGVSNNQRRYFLLAGAMMSCAILCSQKAVFAGLGLALALVWFLCDKRTGWPLKTRAVGCLWIGAGFLIPVGVMCLYFLPNRALDDFIYRNFIMNLGWRSKFWPYGYIRQALKQNPFFCVSGLAGLLIATYQSRHKTEISRGSFAPVVSTYMLIGGLFLMPVPYRQYYLLFIPLLAMYAGLTLATITKYPALSQLKKTLREGKYLSIGLVIASIIIFFYALGRVLFYSRFSMSTLINAKYMYLWIWCSVLAGSIWCIVKLKRQYLALLLLIGIIAYPLNQTLAQFLMFTEANGARRLQLNHSNTGRLSEIRFILQNTTPDDTVLDGWTGSGVFRDHTYYYYFLHSEIRNMLTKQEASDDVIRSLQEKQTKIIIYDGNVQALSPEVRKYVEEHYAPTGVGSLHMLKGQLPLN